MIMHVSIKFSLRACSMLIDIQEADTSTMNEIKENKFIIKPVRIE